MSNEDSTSRFSENLQERAGDVLLIGVGILGIGWFSKSLWDNYQLTTGTKVWGTEVELPTIARGEKVYFAGSGYFGLLAPKGKAPKMDGDASIRFLTETITTEEGDFAGVAKKFKRMSNGDVLVFIDSAVTTEPYWDHAFWYMKKDGTRLTQTAPDTIQKIRV